MCRVWLGQCCIRCRDCCGSCRVGYVPRNAKSLDFASIGHTPPHLGPSLRCMTSRELKAVATAFELLDAALSDTSYGPYIYYMLAECRSPCTPPRTVLYRYCFRATTTLRTTLRPRLLDGGMGRQGVWPKVRGCLCCRCCLSDLF